MIVAKVTVFTYVLCGPSQCFFVVVVAAYWPPFCVEYCIQF